MIFLKRIQLAYINRKNHRHVVVIHFLIIWCFLEKNLWRCSEPIPWGGTLADRCKQQICCTFLLASIFCVCSIFLWHLCFCALDFASFKRLQGTKLNAVTIFPFLYGKELGIPQNGIKNVSEQWGFFKTGTCLFYALHFLKVLLSTALLICSLINLLHACILHDQ